MFPRLPAPSIAPQCSGWLFLAIGRLRIELWTCPFGHSIPAHRHPNIISRFVFLNRNLSVARDGSNKHRPLPWVRFYTVTAAQAHGAHADRGDGWFLNFEWWTGDGKPASATDDIEQ